MKSEKGSIPISYEEEPSVIIPVRELGAVALIPVTLEGNREDGGFLSSVESGESMLSLAGSEDLSDEREAA